MAEPLGIVSTVGPPELLLILVLVLLLFGGAKLPKLARSLGQAQREFRTGLSESDGSNTDGKSDANREHSDVGSSNGSGSNDSTEDGAA